jgi:hypothetical protein
LDDRIGDTFHFMDAVPAAFRVWTNSSGIELGPQQSAGASGSKGKP